MSMSVTALIFSRHENAGYDVTSSEWLEDYDKLYVQARLDWKNEIFTKLNGDDTKFFDAYSATPFFMPSGNPIDEEKAAADGADTAFFVLARIAGENKDRFDTEGDYFISKEEKLFWHRFPDAIKRCSCYQHRRPDGSGIRRRI